MAAHQWRRGCLQVLHVRQPAPAEAVPSQHAGPLWTAAVPAPAQWASDLKGSCVFGSALVPGFDQTLQTALPWTLLDAKGLKDFFGCQCSVGNLWMLGTTEVDGQMIQQTIDGFIMLGGKLHQLL